METTFGRTVETREKSKALSNAEIKDLHNDTFNNFFRNASSSKYPLSNSAINTMNNRKYLVRNSALNLSSDRYEPMNQHELLISTLEKNYELNKQIRKKFSDQWNNFTLPRKEPESVYSSIKTNNDKQSYSTLLPRKKYSSGGYSSDCESYNQFDQQVTRRNYRLNKFSNENRPINNNENMQMLKNNCSNRYKSLDRHDSKNLSYFSTSNANLESPRKFVFNTEANKASQIKNSQEDLIKNINEYFLKWKTFNYDPVNTSNSNLSNDEHKQDFNSIPSERMNSSTNPAANNVHINSIINETEPISSTLPRRSRISECFITNHKHDHELTRQVKIERNRSVDPETFPSHLDRLNEYNGMKSNNVEQLECDNQVEEIVPLENALVNMNEVLKHLTSSAEKKKTLEYNLMQTVINDFEALRRINPQPTSLSISPSVQLSLSIPNPNSISPSASSSSSSYTNSSKTSSSVSNASTNSNSTSVQQTTAPIEATCKIIHRESRASKSLSLGKKLKRFLSLTTIRRQELNKEEKLAKKEKSLDQN